MNPPSEDIAAFLVAASVGVFGTDLFVSREPVGPDACVTVYDTGGMPPYAQVELDQPTVQVRVRGDKGAYKTAFTKMQLVRTTLHGKVDTVQDGARYISIFAMGDVISLGYDNNGRPLLVLNFIINRTTDATP